MAYVSEFERKAWDQRTAERFPPRTACLVAADQIVDGEFEGKVVHAIVVVVEEMEDGCNRINILQAGDLSVLAVEGALGRAIALQQGGHE